MQPTGVLVVDRINGVAYVDISERADEGLARQWADRLGYKDLVTFRWGHGVHGAVGSCLETT